MLLRFLCAVVILLAIAAGLVSTLWREQMLNIVMFRSFFDIALPVLGFGALIKYLCTCQNCCNHKDD